MVRLASQYLDEVPEVDVAILLAHPGDAEIWCGGTIANLARVGKRVAILDLTAGEAGTYGQGEKKLDEAEAAAAILNVTWRACVRLPDARVEDTMMSRMTVTGEIKRLRAKTVVAMHWDARHPDALPSSRLVENACFQAGLPRLDDYLPAHRTSRIVFAGAIVNPDFVVDTTDTFDRKISALRCYTTLFADAAEAIAAMERESRRVGSLIGVRHGEAFVQRDPLPGSLL